MQRERNGPSFDDFLAWIVVVSEPRNSVLHVSTQNLGLTLSFFLNDIPLMSQEQV